LFWAMVATCFEELHEEIALFFIPSE